MSARLAGETQAQADARSALVRAIRRTRIENELATIAADIAELEERKQLTIAAGRIDDAAQLAHQIIALGAERKLLFEEYVA